MNKRNAVSLFLLSLVAIGLTASVLIGKDAHARPNQETYYTYYWDEAMTQYAGEELMLGCSGRRNVMLSGQRAYYYVISSAPCEAGGGSAKACEKCAWIRNNPYNPVCDRPAGMVCPPYIIGW